MARSTEEILENVALLVSFLDDTALVEVSDLPFLEMAKEVSITPLAFPQNRTQHSAPIPHQTPAVHSVSKKQQRSAAPATLLRTV
jgi:hypothetical protein